MSEPGKDLEPYIEHVTDPERVDEIRRQAMGRDLRPPQTEPLEPMNPVGSLHSSGARVLASFPGLGPVGISRLPEREQKAVTRNIAEAIWHQFNVAQIIMWETMPTRRRGIRSAPWKGGTRHFVVDCPALKRAKWAKADTVQRPIGGGHPERTCKLCIRLDAVERENHAKVQEMLHRHELPESAHALPAGD